MIDRSDPLQRLRAANPVPIVDPAAASAPAAVALLSRLLAEEPVAAAPRRRTPRRRLRARARILIPAVLLSGAAGAVGYALMNRDVSAPQTVACYQRGDLGARTQVVVGDSRGPVADCSDLWAAGAFGGTAVPPLAACVLPSGAAGVFPADRGADPCAGLGLEPVATTAVAPPSPPPSVSPSSLPVTTVADENGRFVAFRDAVLPQFLDAPCVDPAAAQAIVRQELDRAGLTNWTVRTGPGVGAGFSADRPCATLSFETTDRVVVLVPAPPRR
jgi:hypothetical protein